MNSKAYTMLYHLIIFRLFDGIVNLAKLKEVELKAFYIIDCWYQSYFHSEIHVALQ
jgi:hypothetical protein